MPTPTSPAPAARGTSLRLLPADLVANLESAPYQYASTMAGIPHYYTLRKKWDADEAFVWTVAEMRKHEVRAAVLQETEQKYLDVNGFQYWTMEAKARETTLINRQYCWHGAYWSRYDAAAQGYDSPWGGEVGAAGETRGALHTRHAPRPRARYRLRAPACSSTTATGRSTEEATSESIPASACWPSSGSSTRTTMRTRR